MEKYFELFKSIFLLLVSLGILISMFRKKMFKNSNKDLYFKSLDYRLVVVLVAGILAGLILTIKELKKYW